MAPQRARRHINLVNAGMLPINCAYGLLLDKPVDDVNPNQCPRSLTCVRKPRHPGWCLDKSKVKNKKRRIPMDRPPRRVPQCAKCADCDRPFGHSGRHNKNKSVWILENEDVVSNLGTPILR